MLAKFMNCFKRSKTDYLPVEVGFKERIQLLLNISKKCKIFRGESDQSKIKEEINELLDQLDTLIREWQGKLPKLEKFFHRDDIDWLLSQAIINAIPDSRDRRRRIIGFVVDTGYKDKPDLDKYGKPILRRITPIHHGYNCVTVTEVLDLFKIYDRFDANYTDRDGLSHFHLACKYGCTDVVRQFLELGQNPNIRWYYSTFYLPLYLALIKHHQTIAELLLRNGADPNLAIDNNKWSPLHQICKFWKNDFVDVFFNISDELNQLVQIEARDKWGNTPLHYAIQNNENVTKSLLRRGANPNSANNEGSTPLHFISERLWLSDDDLAEMFFKFNDELHQRVQVDVRDKKGRTPLRLAVTNLQPNTVDVLLHRGADLSSFFFQIESDFDDCFKIHVEEIQFVKLRLASGLMAVVERLEKRGYELDRCEALTIMKLFSKYGLFEKSTNLAKCWYDDDELATEAKKTMVNSSLSLYDLIQLRPEEVAKLLAYEDCYKFSYTNKSSTFTEIHRKACDMQLSEGILRGFFWRWAMDPFMELINYRLPHLPCEMIMNNLENEDLFHICVAASGR